MIQATERNKHCILTRNYRFLINVATFLDMAEDVSTCTATPPPLPPASTISAVSPSHGYLTSRGARRTLHGTSACPWTIRAEPGQTVDLYVIVVSGGHQLYSSSSSSIGGGGGRPGDDDDAGDQSAIKYCHLYAVVTELSDDTRTFDVCAPVTTTTDRERLVYSSLTNEVVVQIADQLVDDSSVDIILHYIGL